MIAAAWFAGVVALAAPEPPRRQLEASLGLSSALMFEALVLRSDAGVARDHRLVSKPLGVDVGLQWYWRRGQSFATGGWRGWAVASVELMLPRGLFPVGLVVAAVLFLAFLLESRYTKRQILKLYFDRAYMGGGTFGVEAASQYYFGKSVRDITMAEAAMLAGLFKAPSKYSPLVDLAAHAGVGAGAFDGRGELVHHRP